MKTNHNIESCGQYQITKHASVRMRQRGLSTSQIELVLKHGELVDDGYVMTQQAVDRRIAELKHEMKLIERLGNVNVVDMNGNIATAYRVSNRRIRRMRNR